MTGAALDTLDLTAALAAFLEQGEKHGHTADSDGELPMGFFADKATRLAIECSDVARPGGRQDLKIAYRRAARLTAFGLALQRRIRLEQQIQDGASAERGAA